MVSMEEQASQQQAAKKQTGVVKQVTSGDTVVIRGIPRGGPPPEIVLCFSNVFAPKLARKGQAEESDDEPYAWEAREYLRKKVIGKEVQFVLENEIPGSTRKYGRIWLVQDGNATENVVESLISEGLVQVKKGGGARDTEQLKALQGLEEQAKSSGKGQWAGDNDHHIRELQVLSTPDDLVRFYHKNKSAPVKAIVEYVRDCCTLKVTILPEFQSVFLQMTGIRAGPPSTRENPRENPFDAESRFYVESRLLNRDIEIILEDQPMNMALVGTVVHPAGSIAEALVKQGFARCIDQSIQKYTSGFEKLRAAEREAKANKQRIWKEYESPVSNVREDERRFTGKVIEINSADSITIKTSSGEVKKIFLSGIRPPKVAGEGDSSSRPAAAGKFKPLYDIPYMYEAREFLRKKILGQKVDVTLDYKQEARVDQAQRFPERLCCTVMLGDMNVAEALLNRGLVSIVYYKVGDEQRPAAYDNLLMAGNKAKEERKGMHGEKTVTPMRVSEVADANKAKAFLSEFKRGKLDAIVEYVGSGSRYRIYVPKNSIVISVVLAGVSSPKASRMGPNGQILPADEGGEAALNFAKELVAQRDVKVEIENMDKVGNFIGWVFVDGKNVSIELVQAGHASVHDYSAEKSPYYSALKAAEKNAKDAKLNIWKNYDEQADSQSTMPQQEETTGERRENLEKVMVVETLPGLKFFAQNVNDGQKLETLMEDLRQALRNDPPVVGSYTPKKNDLCAARFSADGQWYRAKVESLQRNNKASVLYIDYGNREMTDTTNLAALPDNFKRVEPMAKMYALAFVREHNPEESYVDDVFKQMVPPHPLNLNVEYEFDHVRYVTLTDPETKDDIGKTLVSEGHVLAAPRGGRSRKIADEYLDAQNEAKKYRRNIWQYGDVTEDDAKEFGHQRR
ncbi:hypothetical protein RvY_09176 [Ramazzottius varieornatus]|uniref:Staphylococcal nuclease domain-containing protein 1 n=1 Tax=Ramazzottius varieornatus TaxID=947166 RepID=A0A1D1VD12_RAMVA|nr:hypothetical protein RvY_09176 [Ramazzottius varieornatus]